MPRGYSCFLFRSMNSAMIVGNSLKSFWRAGSLFALTLVLGVFLIATDITYATPTCSPYNYFIGMEYLADSCPTPSSNDNTVYHYTIQDIICHGTTETDASWGDTYDSPASLISYYVGQGFRVFRNTKGTRILIVIKGFNGTVGDINTSQYSPGSFTDVIKEILSNDVFPPAALR